MIKDNINQRHGSRPNQSDLINYNILLNTRVAPALQQSMKELENQKIKTEIEKKIGKRPLMEELQAHNIIKGKY
jgi:hypothetical protein